MAMHKPRLKLWRHIKGTRPRPAAPALQDMGGLLASYGSLAEQKEVEDWFVSRGFMLPQYQRLYWIGLRTPAYKGPGSLSKFTWLDGNTRPPSLTTYSRWGEQPWC